MARRHRIRIADLRPLDMLAHQSLRPELAAMTDEQLLDAVEHPRRLDWLVINTRTGYLHDGNGRAYELLRRARLGGLISPSTTVPVEYYTPNYSMFPDMQT